MKRFLSEDTYLHEFYCITAAQDRQGKNGIFPLFVGLILFFFKLFRDLLDFMLDKPEKLWYN